MGKLRWIRSNYGKSMWILACVLLFGFTPGFAADIYESALIDQGAQVGSCVGALGRMDGAANDLELICGHDLADDTVVVQIWKKSGEDFILVSYAGPKGNPFSLKATLSDADVDELMLGNMYIAVSPTERQEQPILGQIGQMDTSSTWAITEGDELQARAGHLNGWCASVIGRLDERLSMGCYSPNNPDPGLVFTDSGVAFILNGTTTYYRAVTAEDLGEECDDEAVDWKELLRDIRAGSGLIIAGEVTGAIPVPMIVADFATFVRGGGLSTDVVIMNRHTTTDVSGYWVVRDQVGYPVQKENFGPIAPLAAGVVKSSAEGDQLIGTLTIKGNGPMAGVLRYNLPDGVAGVLTSAPGSRVGIVANATSEISTGLAIRNPESRDQTFTIRVIPPAGDRAATDDYIAIGTVTLPPGGQVSKFVSELAQCVTDGCYDGGDFTGVAVITGNVGAVEAVAFEVGPGRFTVLPVAPIVGP